MKKPFRVVTWNLHHGKVSSLAWDYLLELNPDIALLQEVGILPEKISSRFSQYASIAIKKDGMPQRFNTAILVKGRVGEPILLSAPIQWMAKELKRFDGNLMPYRILCNGTWQKSPEVRSRLTLTSTCFTPLHKIRYGIGNLVTGQVVPDNGPIVKAYLYIVRLGQSSALELAYTTFRR